MMNGKKKIWLKHQDDDEQKLEKTGTLKRLAIM